MIKKPLAFGRVREVKETKDYVLMPLSPCDYRASHFFATIIHDLIKLGYEKKDFKHYFKDFQKNNSVNTILNHIKIHGRMIWESVNKNDFPVKKKEIITFKGVKAVWWTGLVIA